MTEPNVPAGRYDDPASPGEQHFVDAPPVGSPPLAMRPGMPDALKRGVSLLALALALAAVAYQAKAIIGIVLIMRTLPIPGSLIQ